MLDVDTLVTDCRLALREEEPAIALKDVLGSLRREVATLVDLFGAPQRSGLEIIHLSPELTVLNVVWAPGMYLEPHANGILTGVVLYSGYEDDDLYRSHGTRIDPTNSLRLYEGQALLLAPDTIRAVRAHPRRYTASLHVCAGDWFAARRRWWRASTRERIANPPPLEAMFDTAERSWQARAGDARA